MRYFDGTQWTEHRASPPAGPEPRTPESVTPTAPRTKRRIFTIAAICAVTVVAVVALALGQRAGKKAAGNYYLDTCQIFEAFGRSPSVRAHGWVTNQSNHELDFTFSIVVYDGQFPIAGESGASTPEGGLQVRQVRPGDTAEIIALMPVTDTSHPLPAAPTCKLVLNDISVVA